MCAPDTCFLVFFHTCLITWMLSSTYRIDEQSSSDGIMYCLICCSFLLWFDFDLTWVHESSSVYACWESRASPLDWRRPFFDATTSRGAIHDFGNVVHNRRKIVENRQNRPESPAGLIFSARLESLNQVRVTPCAASRKLQRQTFHVVKEFFLHHH